jgi:lysozyme
MNHLAYSSRGIALTKQFEGLRLTAYQDSVGVWTIGHGHTGADVHPGLTITQSEASALLLKDMDNAVADVNRLVKVSLTQNQFDALVDFVFNAGAGNFSGSTLLRNLNAGNYAAAAAQFARWVHAGTQTRPGLVARRKAEQRLFLEVDAEAQGSAAPGTMTPQGALTAAGSSGS